MTVKIRLLSILFLAVLLSACSRQPGTVSGGAASSRASVQPLAVACSQLLIDSQGEKSARADFMPEKVAGNNTQTKEPEKIELALSRGSPGIPGGNLVAVMATSDPGTFNPWAAEDSFSLELSGLLFAALADIDCATGEIVPDLAAEITCSPDRLTYYTRLRRGLKWSDGMPINSGDVAFTWNKIVAQAYGNAALRQAALIDGKMPLCTAEDELTNRFVLVRPYVSFQRVLASLKIAPRHVIEDVLKKPDGRMKFKELWAAKSDTSQLVTSGPFTLSAYVPGEHVDFVRANNFYMTDKNGCRLPYLDRFSCLIMPDPGSVLLAFDKKEADLAQIRPRDKSWLVSQQEKEKFRLSCLGSSGSSFFLVFNMNQRKSPKSQKPFVDPAKSLWFNNTDFRQAINHAIDRDFIVREFFKSAGSPAFSCEPSVSPFYNHALKPFCQDLKLSQALLSRSGFIKRNDGYLYDASGARVRFTLSYARSSKLYDFTARALCGDFKKLGISVELQPLETEQVQSLASGIGAKDWEAQLFSVSASPLDPEASTNVISSQGRLHMFDRRDPDARGAIVVDDARPWELRLDQIYKQAAAEFDKKKRKLLYYESQKIVYDQAPFIYLVNPDIIIASRNNLKNFSPTFLSQAFLGLHNLESIYIGESKTAPEKSAQERVFKK